MSEQELISINNRCIQFRAVCDEIIERYRGFLHGAYKDPATKREAILDESMRSIMFVMDVDDFLGEEV